MLTHFLYSEKLIFIRPLNQSSHKYQAIFGSVLRKLIKFETMLKEKFHNELQENISHGVFFMRIKILIIRIGDTEILLYVKY